MNVYFAIAAVLALVAAAIHGGAGERLVVARLPRETLAPSPFGGPRVTMLMIRVTWHIATIAFVVMGSALAACSSSRAAGACVGVGRISAISFTCFGLLAVGLAAATTRRVDRLLVRHPGPLVFIAVAVLAWVGSGR